MVELDEGFGDGWYLGKALKTGTTGLFPGGMLCLIPILVHFCCLHGPVFTTAAPKVHVPQSADAQADGGTAPAMADAPGSLPKSADTTPQASRHPSASGIQIPDASLSTSVPPPSQQRRVSSSPLPSAAMTTDIHQSVRQSIDSHLNNGQDSPVMNETLSVIDEHITDLSTPRHSLAAQDSKTVTDSGSEYSSHVDNRLSYINGNETEEEEENQPSEDEVRRWNYTETARHLRDLGVEAKHSEIFEEQEISGDVLMDMNQDFIFMKEFDFGVMGRRLKTWHKIKAFQEEVKGIKQRPRGSVSSLSGPAEERAPSRAGQPGAFLPRIPSLSERPATGRQQTRGSATSMHHPRLFSTSMHSNSSSPRTPQTPNNGMDSQRRPSAASIRELNHSRRHSSIDTTTRSTGPWEPSPHTYHRKQGSFDKSWSLTGGNQRLPSRPGTSLGTTTTDNMPPHHVFRGTEANEADSAISLADQYDDLDRGYFSGPEGDSRKPRRVLKKRSTTGGHSREPSYDDEQLKVGPISKRHSRMGSADSIRDAAGHVSVSAKAYQGPSKGRYRSLSTRVSDRPGPSAVPEKSTAVSGVVTSITGKTDPESSGRSSPVPLQQIKNAGPKFRRAMGFRAMTDFVGRGIDTAMGSASPARDSDPSSARTGSTTPSATSKSSERHSTDGSGKVAVEGGVSVPRIRTSTKPSKSKKDTSAYIRGLEKRPPLEQMKGCDYSGWMKKRSSNLMTTWKPRLFVLRGRRLSYYYSEKDTEERGLIDITAHRVLRADNDPITALHATITGATVSSTTPSTSAGAPSAGGGRTGDVRGKKESDGPFFFKLVPPKTGTSRTVQFTKPAIHYFQVDTVKQGRLWMAALMKATIDRNMDLPIEMTNKQNTMSLKQARETNQRPPALMNREKEPGKPKERSKERSTEESTEKQTDDKSTEEKSTEKKSTEKSREEKTEEKSTKERSTEERPREEVDGLMIQGIDAARDSGGSEPTKENSAEPTSALEVDTGPTSTLPPENWAESSNR